VGYLAPDPEAARGTTLVVVRGRGPAIGAHIRIVAGRPLARASEPLPDHRSDEHERHDQRRDQQFLTLVREHDQPPDRIKSPVAVNTIITASNAYCVRSATPGG